MSTITNSAFAKLTVAFVAMAMVFSVATPAKAQTLEELQALISQLQAQISALTGGSTSSSAACTFTRSLTIGSQGADVTCLQNYLTGTGHFTFAGGATGYFGQVTQGAVAAWQAANGVSPAVGYFGPISQAKYVAVAGSAGGSTGGSTGGSANLQGGAGSISDVDAISKLSNEEVGEDEEDVEVAGVELEAEGSDIEITAVNLDFDQGTANRDFDKYASEVSIWFDGEEVARLDADEFDDDNNFSRTITLDSGAVIDEDETGELVVAVSGVSNLDSNDETETWTVDIVNVRFRDAQGANITETITFTAETFSFEAFSTASDLEFKVSKGDEDINDARSIAVSSTTDTDGVEILSFNIQVKGNSDVNVDDIAVDFGTSTGDTLTDLINQAELVVDGDVIGSESITSSHNDDGIVVFDSLDWDIDAGDTVEVIVRVDMNELNTGTFAAGATLSASVDPDNASWDVEDENGDDVAAADKTGTATSDDHAFYGDGIQVDMVSQTVTQHPGDSADDDYVTLVLKFDVTSFGETAWIQNAIDETVGTAISSTTPTNAVGAHVQSSDGDLNSVTHVSSVISSTASEGTNAFEVQEGETETFTLTVTVQNAATSTLDNANVRLVLAGVGFAGTDSATSEQMFTSNITDIKTDYGFIAN